MYCKNCGKELCQGVKFCSACGSPVDKHSIDSEIQTAQKESFTVTIVRNSFWLGKTSLYIDNTFVADIPNKTTLSKNLLEGVHTFTITCGGQWSQRIDINGNKKYLLKMHRTVGGLYLEETNL